MEPAVPTDAAAPLSTSEYNATTAAVDDVADALASVEPVQPEVDEPEDIVSLTEKASDQVRA